MITYMLYTHTVDPLLSSKQQEMATTNYYAMSMMLNNFDKNNYARFPPNLASPNLPQLLLPGKEVTMNPPIDILDTNMAQHSLALQLSGPNSHSANQYPFTWWPALL
jgi:hypothetical protein